MTVIMNRSSLAQCAAQPPMHLRPALALILCLLLAVASPLPAKSTDAEVPAKGDLAAVGVPPTFRGDLHSLAALNIRDAQMDVVLDGLDRPWAFEFLAPNEVLISEINGRLLRYRFGEPAAIAINGLPAIASSQPQTGLLDVAVHPQFAQNRRIYFSYSVVDPAVDGYFLTKISTAVLMDTELADLETIVEAGPYSWSPSNFGGAMAFDSEGMLYVSIGDRSEHSLSQRGDRLQGKILRLHDDGRVPYDNPFVDDAGIDDRIYALGVRNPQGLDFDSRTGHLYESEHGPLGGDEVNRIVAGGNYGWPTVTYGRTYAMQKLGEGTHARGMQQPLFYYLPSIATSPLLLYRGEMFPEWDGDLLVGALKGQHVSWLDLDGDRIRSEYPILGELKARIRDLKTAADGSVYILTQTGALHRLHRPPLTDDSAATADAADPAVIYGLVCAGCHDTGAYQAPRPSVESEWSEILSQPIETIYRHTIEGKGNMPARGLCEICSDAHLRATVDHLLDLVSDSTTQSSPADPGEPDPGPVPAAATRGD